MIIKSDALTSTQRSMWLICIFMEKMSFETSRAYFGQWKLHCTLKWSTAKFLHSLAVSHMILHSVALTSTQWTIWFYCMVMRKCPLKTTREYFGRCKLHYRSTLTWGILVQNSWKTSHILIFCSVLSVDMGTQVLRLLFWTHVTASLTAGERMTWPQCHR